MWPAHNPEVAGSNPVPATRQNGSWRSLRGPFSLGLGTLLGTLAELIISVGTDLGEARVRRRGEAPAGVDVLDSMRGLDALTTCVEASTERLSWPYTAR